VETSAERRILVCDDNVDAAEMLALVLRRRGHQVQVTYDGEEALAAALAAPPHLACLDIGLPGMDGFEVARRMRADPKLSDIMLIALTGYGQQEDRRRSAEAGFDHHLVKPVGPEELDRVLNSSSK
jgi:CheY-like chemotaxis protein